MAENNGNGRTNGTLVNVKRVRKDTDVSGREKIVLTFGTDKEGNNGLDALLAALETYRGKQVNFDVRLQEKTGANGASFTSAFVIVKEMIPKDGGTGAGRSSFIPKNKERAEQVKATAAKIKQQFE